MPIDELHLIFNAEYKNLAERIKADIKSVSPETEVIFDIIQLTDPWDFEEVYEKFYDFAKRPCFLEEKLNGTRGAPETGIEAPRPRQTAGVFGRK